MMADGTAAEFRLHLMIEDSVHDPRDTHKYARAHRTTPDASKSYKEHHVHWREETEQTAHVSISVILSTARTRSARLLRGQPGPLPQTRAIRRAHQMAKAKTLAIGVPISEYEDTQSVLGTDSPTRAHVQPEACFTEEEGLEEPRRVAAIMELEMQTQT